MHCRILRIIALVVVLLTYLLQPCKVEAQQIVVRYLDRWSMVPHKEYEVGRLPIYLKYYSDRWHGLIYYSDDSTRLLTGSYTDSNAKTPDGLFVIYKRDGKKTLVATFRQGKLDGGFFTYGPDGEVSAKEFYKAGLKDGLFQAYYPDGSVVEKGMFKAGLPDSIFSTYHPGGRPASLRTYERGRLKAEECFDEAGYKRICSLFRSRDVAFPINFDHFYKEYFTLSKKDFKVIDSVWYLQVVVDRNGEYYFMSLFKRKDGHSVIRKTLYDFLSSEAPELEVVGSLTLRDEIKERLMKLPKAIPAYENNVAMPVVKIFPVWFK